MDGMNVGAFEFTLAKMGEHSYPLNRKSFSKINTLKIWHMFCNEVYFLFYMLWLLVCKSFTLSFVILLFLVFFYLYFYKCVATNGDMTMAKSVNLCFGSFPLNKTFGFMVSKMLLAMATFIYTNFIENIIHIWAEFGLISSFFYYYYVLAYGCQVPAFM